MSIILHITSRRQWRQSKIAREYRDDTLDSDGFIHCSTLEQIIKVANALFHGRRDLVLLCIESDRVKAEIKYEGVKGGELYPHIYGPLNIDAVINVLDLKPDKNGMFQLPRELTVCPDKNYTA